MTPQVTMVVKVKYYVGAYIARIHKSSSSCTSDAKTALING